MVFGWLARYSVLALLLACGNEHQKQATPPPDPPPRQPPVVVDAAPPKHVPTTPLEEARDTIMSKKRRDPTAFVALAHAQVAAKQLDAAKQTLADGLEAARAEKTSEGAKALAMGVDVFATLGDADAAAKLVDETIVRVKKESFNDDLIATLLSPVIGLEHAPLIERLAGLVKRYDKIGERVAPGSPGWNAVVAHAGVSGLLQLATHARHAGEQQIASALLVQALPLAMKDPVQHAGTVLAIELVLAGDKLNAKKVLALDAARAAKHEPALRAVSYADLAAAHALLGDKTASATFEKKALAAAARAKQALEENDELDEGQVGDTVWMQLAIARALRDDIDGAFTHTSGRRIAGDVAWWLVQFGKLEAADRMLAVVDGDEALHANVEAIVAWLARRGDLEAAAKRALEAKPYRGSIPGIEHVMRAYALRGDLAKVEELGKRDRGGLKNIQLDAFTDLAARMLARQGKCDEAVAATKRVAVNRGEAMAVVARYCPDSKL